MTTIPNNNLPPLPHAIKLVSPNTSLKKTILEEHGTTTTIEPWHIGYYSGDQMHKYAKLYAKQEVDRVLNELKELLDERKVV